jgi:hypothetical protein
MIVIEGPWAKWKPFLYWAGYQGDRGQHIISIFTIFFMVYNALSNTVTLGS